MKVQSTIRLDAYAVIERAVEEGVATGYRRAHKHSESPTEDWILETVGNAVMSALSEVIRWEDPE